MLRLLRLVGLLAPLAVAFRLVALPRLEPMLGGEADPLYSVVRDLATAVAGAGVAALLAGLFLGFRLHRLADAAQRIAAGRYDTQLRTRAGGDEARLTDGLNQIARQLAEKHSAATTDRLTQVANRSTVLAALFSEIERVNRYERPLSVLFADIDHFKSVNDTYGHPVGDMVLRRVAEILRHNIRSTDLVGRYGGEEFILVLTETDVQEAANLAEKLRMLVMRERFTLEDGQTLNVTISLGIAGGVGERVRFDTIVRDADAAMFSAKNLGRNQTYLFSEPDDDSRVPRAPISTEGRIAAVRIGRAARVAAEEMLNSVVAPLPHYGGRPSPLIAQIATTMARHLQLPDAEIDRIRVASLLHDVGKVAVPSDILAKPAPLSSHEWQSVVQHPRIGQLILEQAGSLRDAVPIILHHHERYSGHGYPYGLRGQDIPLGARIVAIADAYDAMMNDRPYRAAIGSQRALGELQEHAGTQFDPELVELFCDLFAAGIPGYEFDGDSIRPTGEPMARSSPRPGRSSRIG